MTPESAIHMMNEESRQEYWDECWDTITTITPKDGNLLPICHDVIVNPGYNTTSKHYALSAIERIDPKLDRSVNSVIQSLEDKDFEIQGHATQLLGSYKGDAVDGVVKALITTFRTNNIVGVKKDALVSLTKLIGWKKTLASLMSN